MFMKITIVIKTVKTFFTWSFDWTVLITRVGMNPAVKSVRFTLPFFIFSPVRVF